MGKLFKQLRHGSSANMKHRGKRLSGGGAHSLTGIMKTVLGAPLCKVTTRPPPGGNLLHL